MAVQQRRKSRAKRDSRRTHDRLRASALATDPVTGETHRRHHVTPEGFYRGRKVIAGEDED